MLGHRHRRTLLSGLIVVLVAAGSVVGFTVASTSGPGSGVDARIAAQYSKHHHTIVVSCAAAATCVATYLEVVRTPYSQNGVFPFSPSQAPNLEVWWRETFHIAVGSSVSFTFANLPSGWAQALDLARAHLSCSNATATGNQIAVMPLSPGTTVTGGPISPQTFTTPALDVASQVYWFVAGC